MRIIGRRRFLIAAAGVATVGCTAAPTSTTHDQKRPDLRAYDKPASLAPAYPPYVTDTVRDAYDFAVSSPAVLNALPCYCGCGLSVGHQSNLDCFVAGVDAKGAIVFDDHGSFCQTCVDIAHDAKRLRAAGRSLREIRAEIDTRHGGKGPGTDTPLPAGS